MRTRVLLLGTVGLLGFILAGCMALFNHPPVADFSWHPSEIYAGQSVRFDASSSYDPDPNDEILGYLWDFGDGTKASGVIVEHTYSDNGTFSVTLSVSDRCGKKDSVTKTITVLNPPPEISGITIYDYNGYRVEAGDLLRFCVEALDPASIRINSIAQIEWDFGDGSAPGFGKCVNHCYWRGCRYYTIKVTVRDDDGAEVSMQRCIYVYCKDECPSAIIQFSPSQPHVGEEITLDGSRSHDNDRCCVPCPSCPSDCSLEPECNGCCPGCSGKERIVSYKWEIFPPTGDSIIRWGATIKFKPVQTGSYLIQLSVKDDENNWDTTATQLEVLP